MISKSRFLPGLALLSTAPVAWAGLLGLSNYDECITESMRGVTSDVAARAVIQSCRNRFPEPKQELVELPSEAQRLVTGRAGLRDKFAHFRALSDDKGASKSYLNELSGVLYNGNNDWVVKGVDVVVTWSEKGDKKKRTYRATVDIPPLTERSFSVEANTGSAEDIKQIEWYVSNVLGFRAK